MGYLPIRSRQFFTKLPHCSTAKSESAMGLSDKDNKLSLTVTVRTSIKVNLPLDLEKQQVEAVAGY
jgi:hypothetical protein